MHTRKLLLPTAVLLACLIPAAASAAPTLRTNQACYTVGQRVGIIGSAFAPLRTYQVSLDGLNFGTSKGTTDATGVFTASIVPGGLGANIPQAPHILGASDGTSTATTKFTVTRNTGARTFSGTGRTVATFRARFELWGFAIIGIPLVPISTIRVYVHYVSPRKRLRKTLALGHLGGQCGYLKTRARRVFPFTPARGTWTLQVDTKRPYTRHPAGPVARIKVRVA